MNERYVIPSLDRAIQVLEILSRAPGGLGLAEMARMSEVPKSTLYRILVTLQQRHCVAWHEKERVYRLGSRLWELGNRFLDQSDLYPLASRQMEALAERSGETVFLGMLEDGEIIYLRRVESPKSVTIVKKLGQRVPAHCTATGMAVLAFLPEEEVDAIWDVQGLQVYNEATVIDRETLKRRLEKTRHDGYAVVDGEYNRELLCISAPIFDHTYFPRASLTVAMLTSQTDAERVKKVAAMVQDASQDVSRSLGYLGSRAPTAHATT